MPSILHEAFVDVLRTRRDIALKLVRTVKVPVAAADWQWLSVDGGFADPGGSGTIYRTDVALVAFPDPAHRENASEALSLEAQLRCDPEKSLSVPFYRAGLRLRFRCRASAAMLSPSERVIEWTRDELFSQEPDLCPYLIGPKQVKPVLRFAEARKDPGWAAVTAAVHGRSRHACRAAKVALKACAGLPPAQLRRYARLIMAGLSNSVAREVKQELPPELDEPVSEYEQESYMYVRIQREAQEKSRAEGEAQGLRKALLLLLDTLGLEPTPEERATLEACTDRDRLERWLRAAPQARTVAELLTPDRRP